MANDLQKELQVSHLLGQRHKSVKRVKSGRTSAGIMSTPLHLRMRVRVKERRWKKREDKARQNITSVLRAITHCERMFRMHVTHGCRSSALYYNHNIFAVINYCLLKCKLLCLWEKRFFEGLDRQRIYGTINQTGALQQMRVKREGGKTK